MVASQGLGPGVLLCGTGLVSHSPLLVALGRHASGNVQVMVRWGSCRLLWVVVDGGGGEAFGLGTVSALLVGCQGEEEDPWQLECEGLTG